MTARVAYASGKIALCEAAILLPVPPTGAGGDVSDFTSDGTDGDAVVEVELTLLAAADCACEAGSCVYGEEVIPTYLETSAAITTTHATDTINLASHGFFTGDGPVRLTADSLDTDPTVPPELSAFAEYWVIKTGSGTFKLAASHALALAGTAIAFGADLSGSPKVRWVAGIKSTSTAASGVSTTALEEWLTFAASHGIATGTRVQVANSGGSLPTGLVADTDYYAVAVAADKLQFATSYANATATTPVIINLTAAGSGTNSVISDNRGPTDETVFVEVCDINDGFAFDLKANVAKHWRFFHRPGVTKYHVGIERDTPAPITAYVQALAEID